MKTPLWRRSPLRLLRSGMWAVLVAASFAGLAFAAAASPLFADSASNAALEQVLSTVPADAPTAQGPAVRLSGVMGRDAPVEVWTQALSNIDSMTPPVRFARSVAPELSPRYAPLRGVVSRGGNQAEGRLVGVDDPGSKLRPVEATQGERGVWIPQPLADRLELVSGDSLEVGLTSPAGTELIETTVVAIYAVAGEDRTPADLDGSQFWHDYGHRLPRSLEFGNQPAFAIIAEVETAGELGEHVGDTVLMSIDSRIETGGLTLARAVHVRSQVLDLRSDVIADQGLAGGDSIAAWRIVSGIPGLVVDAADLTRALSARMTTVAFGGMAVAASSVLALGLLGLAGRRSELRLEATLGSQPASVAARHGLEMLPAALLGTVCGTGAALALITWRGPGILSSGAVVAHAGRDAAYAVLAGWVLIVLLTWAAMQIVSRPGSGHRRRAGLVWEALLLVAAATALYGLLTSPTDARTPASLDLVLPVLLAAAIGALGARTIAVVSALLGRLKPQERLPRSPAAAVRRLARRRAVSGTGRSVAIVTLLTTGLAIGGYALLADAAVPRAVEDKVSTASGAYAYAALESSALLDPQAIPFPSFGPDDPPPSADNLPPRRQPPLPEGLTVVWRSSVAVADLVVQPDLLVVDPSSFLTAASWGPGRDLQDARAALRTLSAGVDDTTNYLGALPIIAVGAPSLRAGDFFSAGTADGRGLNARVIASVAAFPGYSTDVPLLVVAAEPYLSGLLEADPRWREAATFFSAQVWGRPGETGVGSVLTAAGIDVDRVRTAASLRQQPEFAAAEIGGQYQLGVGVAVVALAFLGVAFYADRRAAANPAGDLLLSRTGMGRSAPLLARVLEMMLIIVAGFGLGWLTLLGLIELGPRLLDPDPRSAPELYLQLTAMDYLIALAALGVCLVTTAAVVVARVRSTSAEEVLRDAQ